MHLLSYVRVAAESTKLGLASTATQDNVPQQTVMVLFHSQNRMTDTNKDLLHPFTPVMITMLLIN